MGGEQQPTVPRFRPLGRITPTRQILLAVAAPLLWLIALLVTAFVAEQTDAIRVGLMIAGGAFVVAFIVLVFLRAARRNEERRYDGP